MSKTMQKSRKVNILFHLSVLGLAVVLDPPKALDLRSIIVYLVTRIFPLGIFYACYFWLVPRYLAKRKPIIFAVLLLVLLNLTTLIGYLSLEATLDIYNGNSIHLFYRWNMHFSGLFVLTVAAIFGIAFRSITGWYEEMHTKSMLEQEKLQNELLLLKAQINPHFLFNTLNSIDFLIHADQPKASEYLIKLSSLLRYVIYDTVKEMVTLQQEMEQMKAYVDLQRLRYGEKGSVICEISGDASGKMVAPMLFIPFIENAFKHTNEAGIQKGFSVYFRIDGDSVAFTCKNHIALREDLPNGGFGLANVKKRLEMQYHNRHSLSIDQTEDVFTVALTINLQ